MLLCKRHKKIRLVITVVLVCICLASGQLAADGTMGFIRDEYKKVVMSLAASQDGDVNELLIQWHDYVAEITNFANEDYLAAINDLQADYYREIANYEMIAATVKSDLKDHSPEWLDNLIQHFGKDYVKKNREAIHENIMFLFHDRHEVYFRKASEKLVYKEAVLYGVYKGYFGLFSGYSKTLSLEEQEHLRSQKEAIENFLSLLTQHSATNMLNADNVPSKEILAIRARRHDQKLFTYFRRYSTARNFDPMKAAKELSRMVDQR